MDMQNTKNFNSTNKKSIANNNKNTIKTSKINNNNVASTSLNYSSKNVPKLKLSK